MDSKDEEKPKEEVKRFTIKNPTDLQRIRLEKLMKNPAKEVIIPDRPKIKELSDSAPSFVRNVMGSSAGAGSGEFHVYRHLRRKEYARLKEIEQKGLTEKLDEQFQAKLDNNRRMAEEKTAKKRAKRLKRKEKLKRKKDSAPAAGNEKDSEASDCSESERDEETDEKPKSDNEFGKEPEGDTEDKLVTREKQDPGEKLKKDDTV